MNTIVHQLTFGKFLFLLVTIATLVTLFFLTLIIGVWLKLESDEVEIFTKNQLVINLLAIALISAGIGVVFLYTGLRWHDLTREAVSQKQLIDVLRERVRSLSEQAHSKSRKVIEFPDGLTEREVDIIRLITAGKTDREVGRELFISHKTVGNHLSNIRSKVQANNRTEVATYAIRHNLV